ncbi:MAG: four helix bundle protein [Phycisphaerales bacterium]|nr:four helix bundle protein [Phycisphaerales bacterium]
MHDFRKLVVWQKASASIGLNLAEGGGKKTDLDHANYVQRAIGSSCEVEYAILLCRDLGYLTEAKHDPLQLRVVEIRKMLLALADRLRGT